MRSDIQKIFKETPVNKQVMMFSATMSEEGKKTCRMFMRDQFELFIDDDTKLTLHGLLQYYESLEDNQKIKRLIELLDSLMFN